jgi:hypothetical protein
MKSTRSKRLRSLGLFIVLVALILSYYFNGMQTKTPTINTRETDRIFEDLPHTKKIELDVSVKSFDLLRKMISTKLEGQGAIKLNSEEHGGFSLYIYQIDPLSLNMVLSDLSEIGTITNKVEKVNTQSADIDLEQKLIDREALYQKELQDYNNSKTKYSFQMDRINQLSKEVDSLKFEIKNQRNKVMTLLYIKAQTQTGNVGRIRNYQKFVFDFLKYIVLCTFVVAFIYFGTIALVYFMALLGIRFPSLGRYLGKGYNYYAGYKGYTGYSGYRGYGRYGYGGSRKRKVKRIYRDKHSSESESEDESNK